MIVSNTNPVALLVLMLIRIYQKTVSPDTGFVAAIFPMGFCRFHPTCSSYTYDAVRRYGVMRGLYRGILRIIRCNPWNAGGLDPLH